MQMSQTEMNVKATQKAELVLAVNTMTSFKQIILRVLNGMDKPSGLELKAEVEKNYPEVNHGRLYPNLDELVESEFIMKGQADRRTNWYEITEKGQMALEARREWENQYSRPENGESTV